MENKYKELSLEDIENSINSYFREVDTDDSIKPDIVIETSEPSYFTCSIKGDSANVTTGIGGFKMFLKELPGLLMLKVSFNGRILNEKEKQKLYVKYK